MTTRSQFETPKGNVPELADKHATECVKSLAASRTLELMCDGQHNNHKNHPAEYELQSVGAHVYQSIHAPEGTALAGKAGGLLYGGCGPQKFVRVETRPR